MRYNDGPHNAGNFLFRSTRPTALTENEKFVQLDLKVVNPRELQRRCRCHLKGNERQNCWNCMPVDRWDGPRVDGLEKEHAFSVDYKQIVPKHNPFGQ